MDFILHLDVYLAELIQGYGSFVYVFLSFIIFLETGFVLTPFLPGDSLLFVSGAFAGVGALNIYLLFLFFCVAAVLGDTANYWIGRYLGEKVFIRFIRQEHLEKTKSFFARYGKKTIVLARFVPIVRTFAPFVAGVGRMNYSVFLSYNVFGGISWVAIFALAGFYFGNIPFVKSNLTFIVLLIVVISFIPMIWGYSKRRHDEK